MYRISNKSYPVEVSTHKYDRHDLVLKNVQFRTSKNIKTAYTRIKIASSKFFFTYKYVSKYRKKYVKHIYL